ncbi:MAG TPA: DUF881 domain-containing protein [Nocardioides sp.]|nr:DUF881 domain-containing protein [Nocardioides sp.]
MSSPDQGPPEHRPHRAPWHARLRSALTAPTASRLHPTRWRLLAPATFVLAGALFVASANTAGGTDIRGGRITDLAGLARAETDKLAELRNEQARLAAEVEVLSDQLAGTSSEVVERAQALREPAGLAPVRGPGLTVTLTDAPDAVIESAETEIENLVVHQQDIQAVVNALWAGGAEAMTVQGQRVVSTTGIRCVGNTVVLHDVPYAPPYVISAIGPTEQMSAAIDASPYIGFYLQVVEQYQLGWDLRIEEELEMPGYVGSTALEHARPVADDAA